MFWYIYKSMIFFVVIKFWKNGISDHTRTCTATTSSTSHLNLASPPVVGGSTAASFLACSAGGAPSTAIPSSTNRRKQDLTASNLLGDQLDRTPSAPTKPANDTTALTPNSATVTPPNQPNQINHRHSSHLQQQQESGSRKSYRETQDQYDDFEPASDGDSDSTFSPGVLTNLTFVLIFGQSMPFLGGED